LERYPIAGGSVQFALDGNRWAVADNIASFNALLPDRPAGAHPTQPVGSLNLGLRRHSWDQVGTFDEELVTSEDYDWILRARGIGLEVFFDPAAVVEHGDARQDRRSLEEHAAWYGRHFNTFRQKHPGVFDRGPTWQSRRRLASTRALKAWIASLKIFLAHPMLLRGWHAFPGVVTFKMAWYQAILDTWPES
jgi:GT2 family glycosyltransferase